MLKTNAARLLDAAGIHYELIPYEYSEEDLSAGKVAASISGNKSCAMVHVKELLGLTGYIRGGCSPIGMKKSYPTFIHESALLYDYIYISAGVRGLQFKIAPSDLFSYTGARIYPI